MNKTLRNTLAQSKLKAKIQEQNYKNKNMRLSR